MLGIALFVGLASGAAPAIAAARANVHGALKESSRSSADSARRRRIRSALVVSEFAMALVLLASAGLAIRSFAALLAVDPGFEPTNMLSLQVSLKGTPQADTSRRRAFFGEMIDGPFAPRQPPRRIVLRPRRVGIRSGRAGNGGLREPERSVLLGT